MDHVASEELVAVSSRQPIKEHAAFVPENQNNVQSPRIEIKSRIQTYTTVHYGVIYIDVNKIISKKQGIDEVRRLLRVSGLAAHEVNSFLTRLDEQQLNFLFD